MPRHFVAYHSERTMERRFTLGRAARTSFFSAKPESHLRKAIDQTLWMISGDIAGRRTTYRLHGTYVGRRLRAREDDTWLITGPVTWRPDTPIPLDAQPWFATLLRTQNNFSLGLNEIRDHTVIDGLDDLRSSQDVAIPTPPGNPAPTRIVTQASHYPRDERVRAEALRRAAGACELCGQPAPFVRDDGTPFLESHHLVALAERGPDTLENIAALCPNCHRRLHHAADRVASTQALLARRRGGRAR